MYASESSILRDEVLEHATSCLKMICYLGNSDKHLSYYCNQTVRGNSSPLCLHTHTLKRGAINAVKQMGSPYQFHSVSNIPETLMAITQH